MKIINTNIVINEIQREIIISVVAHKSTKFQYISGYATRFFQKNKEVRDIYKKTQSSFTAYGISNTEPVNIEGFDKYLCRFTY